MNVLIAGLISGTVWGVVALMLFFGDYRGQSPSVALFILAGTFTGAVIGFLSHLFYRNRSLKSLLWISPLSVYLSIVFFCAFLSLTRDFFGDHQTITESSARFMESIQGMAFGVTFLIPYAMLVHFLAYLNHQVLWRLVNGPPNNALQRTGSVAKRFDPKA